MILLCATGLCVCGSGCSSYAAHCRTMLSRTRHCTIACTSNLRARVARLFVHLWHEFFVVKPLENPMTACEAKSDKHSLLCVSAAKQSCQAELPSNQTSTQHAPKVFSRMSSLGICLGSVLPLSVLPCAFRGTFYIQYETLEELGEGAFGKALKCRRRRDNQIFVVKIMHESKMSAKAIEEVTSTANLRFCVLAT